MTENAVKTVQTVRGIGSQARLLVGSELDEVERIISRTLAPFRVELGPLVRHLQHYRGKRLRPILLLLAGRACGRLTADHPVMAAVVELIHTATLVHDDVLDESALRRHVDTVNARWGNKTSILLGDLLFSTAFHLSSTRRNAKLCEWIGHATNRVCAGELRQTMERGNLELSEDDYLAMIEGKTAALTECSGRLGAILAGADDDVAEKLAEYGRCLGIAFQIADDLLDLTGTEAAAGKTLGTDMEQGKLTLPLIHHLERLSPAEAGHYRRRLADGQIDHQQLLTDIRESGSLESAASVARQYADRAAAAVAVLADSAERTLLEELAAWAIHRDA